MPNALANETSPYLLQHTENPVNWQPWSDDAFAQAAAQNKLVFLSVGYSTCHWCHVMAHESFESEAIAHVLNHHFVCVKVDREERPDIDAAYMQFVQATTGHGGWPMSVWLTPQGDPVFGGTYFPPDDRHARPGLSRICNELGRLWRDDRKHMQERAAGMMQQLRDAANASTNPTELPANSSLTTFISRCQVLFDDSCGGFGGAPKFPRPVLLRTLMQLADRAGIDSQDGQLAWSMCQKTLHAMADGGIHDHLAGGFHRYSVDRYWHVPHYEKMLYDQPQLAMAYLDGWQISGDPKFRSVTEGIFRYLLDDLRDDGGAFHAAEDADSLPTADATHTREGAYWTWSAEELSQLLAPRSAAIFSAAYGVEANGNARPESDPHHELTGQNTLFRAQGDDQLANLFETTIDDIQASLADACSTLLQARRSRPLPHRDDKIVTAWNGLTIAALARGARLLDRNNLLDAAIATTTFIQSHLWHDSALYRSYRHHRGNTTAFPADYSSLIHGLIELHAATLDPQWLDWAQQLQDSLDSTCWDNDHCGYLMKPSLAGSLILPIRDDHDGAEPSPNHLAIDNLLKLAVLLDEPRYQKRATQLLTAGAMLIKNHPFSAPLLLSGLDLHDRGVAKVQLKSTPDDAERQALQRYHPRIAITGGATGAATICDAQSCRPLI